MLPYMTAGQVIIGSCGYNVILETARILTYLAWLCHEAMQGCWAARSLAGSTLFSQIAIPRPRASGNAVETADANQQQAGAMPQASWTQYCRH